MSKFKKGDKIKILKNSHPSDSKHNSLIGKTGIIFEIDDNSKYPIRVKTSGSEFESVWNESELILLPSIKLKAVKSTHIILYGEHNYIAYGRKERDEKIKELVDNKVIDNDDITIYDIKSESKVICDIKTEEIK